MPRVLLLATHNAGKLREFTQLLADLPLQLHSLAQLRPDLQVVEDGDTFEANATKKAVEVAAATGHLVLSDDSGLEVDALGGRPGVRSARFAGDHASDHDNNQRLVRELQSVPRGQRTARYRVVLALCDPTGPLAGRVQLETGSCEGHITLQPRGEGGFGYDPYFVPQGHERTMAELPPTTKNQLSHRGQAARKMKQFLTTYLTAR